MVTDQLHQPVIKSLVGLTDLAWTIAREEAASVGCSSVSEWVEWVILCQRFSAAESSALLSLRRKRGSRGGVKVLPDDAMLPPEG